MARILNFLQILQFFYIAAKFNLLFHFSSNTNKKANFSNCWTTLRSNYIWIFHAIIPRVVTSRASFPYPQMDRKKKKKKRKRTSPRSRTSILWTSCISPAHYTRVTYSLAWVLPSGKLSTAANRFNYRPGVKLLTTTLVLYGAEQREIIDAIIGGISPGYRSALFSSRTWRQKPRENSLPVIKSDVNGSRARSRL